MSYRVLVTTVLGCLALTVLPGAAGAAVDAAPAGPDSQPQPESMACGQIDVLLGTVEPVPVSECEISFCVTVQDCYDACPEATSASCVNNACQYDSGGGGGGGGGGECNISVCTSDQECYEACPEASFAYCDSNNACVYP